MYIHFPSKHQSSNGGIRVRGMTSRSLLELGTFHSKLVCSNRADVFHRSSMLLPPFYRLTTALVHVAEQRLNVVGRALSYAVARITTLEATCKELQDANSLLKAKVNELEGCSRRLNIRIVGEGGGYRVLIPASLFHV